jgi:plasmid stabilization system protein ParE
VRVILDPLAEEEARHAYLWYADRNAVAAARFQADLTEAIEQLGAEPLFWPEIERGVRRRNLDRFPYALIFRVAGDEILVVAVMHQRRRPGHWRSRVS